MVRPINNIKLPPTDKSFNTEVLELDPKTGECVERDKEWLNSHYGYIYLIVNPLGEFYIGRHKVRYKGEGYKCYMGSSRKMKDDWAAGIYTKNDCVKYILKTAETELRMNLWECYFIEYYHTDEKLVNKAVSNIEYSNYYISDFLNSYCWICNRRIESSVVSLTYSEKVDFRENYKYLCKDCYKDSYIRTEYSKKYITDFIKVESYNVLSSDDEVLAIKRAGPKNIPILGREYCQYAVRKLIVNRAGPISLIERFRGEFWSYSFWTFVEDDETRDIALEFETYFESFASDIKVYWGREMSVKTDGKSYFNFCTEMRDCVNSRNKRRLIYAPL